MMNFRSTLLRAALATFALGAAAAYAETGILTGDSSVGKVLTNADGMTLYTYDKDQDGKSACYDKCAKNWPPLVAPAGAAPDDDFGLTERQDGSMQWTYYGRPLYLWKDDAKPGDVTGNGVGGAWHVAAPRD